VNFFATNLKYLIRRFATSQQELALHVKKSQTSISNWISEVSEPDVSDLIRIHSFFGISLDALVMVNLSDGNLITDQHVKEFQANGNLIGNPIGNLKTIFPGFKPSEYERKPAKKEEQSVTEWTVINILKQMDGKLDGIRVVADKILDKTPRK
jgi:transcriptional regulator with XRE-family HTH domain